jgi:hypothetical protein
MTFRPFPQVTYGPPQAGDSAVFSMPTMPTVLQRKTIISRLQGGNASDKRLAEIYERDLWRVEAEIARFRKESPFACMAIVDPKIKEAHDLSDPLLMGCFIKGDGRGRSAGKESAKVRAKQRPLQSGSMKPMGRTSGAPGRPPQNLQQQQGQTAALSGNSKRVEKRAAAEGDRSEHPPPKQGKYNDLMTSFCLASRCRQGPLCCNADGVRGKQAKTRSTFIVFCCSACAVEGKSSTIDASKGAWFCCQGCWDAAHNKA